MRIVILTHKTALEFWRKHGGFYCDVYRRVVTSSTPVAADTETARMLAGSYTLSLPLDVLRCDNKSMRSTDAVRWHMLTAGVDAPCIVHVGKDLYVISPELCFIQMMQELSFIKRVELGFEFCGFYTVDPSSGNAKKRRAPLMTPEAVVNLIGNVDSRRPGSDRALEAIKYVAPNSFSPAETFVTMLLTLPYKRGGFGLPKPELNREIAVRKSMQELVHRDGIKPDLLWQEQKVAVEYDSEREHSDSEQREFDNRRSSVAQDMGYQYIVITKSQLVSAKDFEIQAHLIARKVGKRIRPTDPLEFKRKHAELRAELSPWLVRR